MRTKARILISLMLALCLLSGGTALAQEMPSASAVLEAGKSLRYTATLSLDEQQMMALLKSQLPQGEMQIDRTIAPVANLAKIMKELVISGSLYQEGVTFSLGSDKGEVIAGEVGVYENGKNEFLLNLLPGYVFSMPEEMIKQMQAEAAKKTPFTEAEIRQMEGKYLDVIIRAFNDKVMGDVKRETGAFQIDDAGSFAMKRDFVFTAGDMGILLRDVLEELKTDKRAQELVMMAVDMVSAIKALNPDGYGSAQEEPKPTIEDLIATFARSVVALETEGEQDIFHVTVFEREDHEHLYAQISTVEPLNPQVYLIFQVKNPMTPEALSVKADMMVTHNSPFEGRLDEADWADVHKMVTGVRDGDKTIVNLAYDATLPQADARLNTRLSADIKTEFVSIGLLLDSDVSTKDQYEARRSLSVSLDHEKPLVTLHAAVVQEDEPQKMVKPEQLKTLVIDESFGQDKAQLKALTKALFMEVPDFLMRLKTAFPDAYEYVAELVAEASMQ